MVAIIFEDVVVFVFDLPTGAAGLEDGFQGLVVDEVIGNKGVVIEYLLGLGMGDGHFTPVEV